MKRVDAKHSCSIGTSFNSSSLFITPSLLPHGSNGIIVGNGVKVGKKCIIYHQVTIAG